MRLLKQPVSTVSKPEAPVVGVEAINETVEEFGARNRISPAMVRKMLRVGVRVHVGEGLTEIARLPAFSVGKRVLIPRDASAAFMARLRNAPPMPIKRKGVSQ